MEKRDQNYRLNSGFLQFSMKKYFLGAIPVFLVLVILSFFLFFQKDEKIVAPLAEKIIKREKPLEKYAFENLKKKVFKPSEITFAQLIKNEPAFSSYLFFFNDQEGKKISGLANIPKNKENAPIIIMFRGYVDREIYETGAGTQHAGEFFAKNGFLTLAPDFLGYGESDMPSFNPLEERFQTYTTALSLLASVENVNPALENVNLNTTVDSQKTAIWGHSNGGHIALASLAITGKSYPATLWTPVSKPFPYSILYYTDDFDDHGKFLRKIVADFEKDYDVEKYSPANFLSWINAPMLIHQGSADDSVPQKWSDQLNKKLSTLEKDVVYYIYPGDDHNFARGSWNTVVNRDLSFFRKHLEIE